MTRPIPPATAPALSGFLEEQLWALRDRTDALAPLRLSGPLAAEVAAIDEALTRTTWLLRRSTSATRDAVSAVIARLRGALERIEHHAWPAPAPLGQG